MSLKTLNLRRVLAYDLRLRPLRLREELEDVVEFQVVVEAGQNLDGAEGAVAVVVAILEGRAELELFRRGQGEEGLCNGELLVDLGLGEADVGDVEEAWGMPSCQGCSCRQGLFLGKGGCEPMV